MRARRPMVVCGAALGLALAASGCSQLSSEVEGATAYGGDRASTVRAATIDVLLAQAVAVRVWPGCVETGKQVSCTGTTVDGAAIVVESPGTSPVTLTITVGGQQVFSGEAIPVLDAAAGKSP